MESTELTQKKCVPCEGFETPLNKAEAGALLKQINGWSLSDDGKKIDAIVAQLSRRKPVLKKALSEGGVSEDAAPDSVCVVPAWQRGPVRVSFEATGAAKQTFAIRGHVVDMVNDTDDAEEASK